MSTNTTSGGTYTTTSGDMWDSISFKVFGSSDYVTQLMLCNSDYVDLYVFPAGIELKLPEIEGTEELLDILPPWRR